MFMTRGTIIRLCSFLLFFLLTAGLAWAESPDDILVIANKSVALDSISKKEVADLFLKKRSIEDNKGNKLTPINAAVGSPIRGAWAKLVLGMDPSKEMAHWKKQLVKSGTKAPKGFPNTLAAVFSVKNSISYIKRSDHKAGLVKVLAVITP